MKLSCTEDYIFHTIQGEGRYVGVPSVFLRLSGCNLRCAWKDPNSDKISLCDTPYSSHNPEKLIKTLDQVTEDLLAIDCRHIVITGGEPYMQKAIAELIQRLVDKDRFVSVETNASLFFPTKASFVSLSPKLYSSCYEASKDFDQHNKRRYDLESIFSFCSQHEFQLKFVVNQESDLQEILSIKKALEDRGISNLKERIFLMPQALTKEELDLATPGLIEICKRYDFSFCDRLHIRIWGSKRAV